MYSVVRNAKFHEINVSLWRSCASVRTILKLGFACLTDVRPVLPRNKYFPYDASMLPYVRYSSQTLTDACMALSRLSTLLL